MKTRHLFASVALASVFAGCSQEELVNANNEMQALENRPMVEAPVLDFGVESRMTTNPNGNFATVKWQEGDGFGAAVMDNYVADGKNWEEMFPIQNYINSNVLFSYNNATGKFEADASMPMGNHLFYAPFNKANISRQPLAVSIPLTQVVKPVEGQAVSNSAVTAFYEDVTTPVFFAYDKVDGEAKTSLSLSLNHIFALPHVTLDFGKVRLTDVRFDSNGDGKVNTNDEYVWEDELTISKIVFTNGEKKILSAGTINNEKVINQLKRGEDNKCLWDRNKFETNTTAALLNEGEYNATSNKFGQVTDKAITVNFEGGMTISDAQDARFILILPGAEYKKNDLSIEVYATVNGEEYVLVENLSGKKVVTLKPERDMRLLPGYPYAADEYNADGTTKASKGSSFVYTVTGPFAPVETAVETGYYEIETYDDLKTYIEDVAYRGEALYEMTAEAALNAIHANSYNKHKQFVITATADAPIIIDEEMVKTFNNSCVITGKSASLNFLGGNANLVLGDMNYDADVAQFTFEKAAQVAGNVSLEGEVTTDFPKGINLLSTANVDLTENLTNSITVLNVANGIVNVNSALAHEIWNDYGTLNVNVSTAAKMWNGYPNDKDDIEDYFATMKIADDVVTSGSIENRLTGIVEINDAVVAIALNDGNIKMNDAAGKVGVTAGNGAIDNTEGAKVEANTNTVYAEVNTLNLDEKYDILTGLNKLVVKNVLTSDEFKVANGIEISVIDFESGSGINFAALADADLDFSNVDVINIKADMTWRGRDITKSFVTVKANAIKEAEDCELILDDICVKGYKSEANAENLGEVIKGGGVVTLVEELTKSQKSGEIANVDGVNVELALNEQNVSIKNAFATDIVFKAMNGAELTLTGEGDVSGAILVKAVGESTKVVIEGGNWIGENRTQYGLINAANQGEVVINGAYFEYTYVVDNENDYEMILNGESGKIVVKKGTFKNYNPAVAKSKYNVSLAEGAKVRVMDGKEDVTKQYASAQWNWKEGKDLIYIVE